MCTQDILNARKRYVVRTSVTPATPTTFQPNRKRVCISFSISASAAGDFGYIFEGPTTLTANLVACVSAGAPNLMYRIEDFGSLVTGRFDVNTTGGLAFTVIEVLVDDENTPQLQH